MALRKIRSLTFLRSRFTTITLTYLSRRFTRRERRDSILTWMQTFVISFTKLLNMKDTNFMERYIRSLNEGLMVPLRGRRHPSI